MTCPCTADCCAAPRPYQPDHVCEVVGCACDEHEPLECDACGMICLCRPPMEIHPGGKTREPMPEWPALNRAGPSPLRTQRTRDVISVRPQKSTRVKR